MTTQRYWCGCHSVETRDCACMRGYRERRWTISLVFAVGAICGAAVMFSLVWP